MALERDDCGPPTKFSLGVFLCPDKVFQNKCADQSTGHRAVWNDSARLQSRLVTQKQKVDLKTMPTLDRATE